MQLITITASKGISPIFQAVTTFPPAHHFNYFLDHLIGKVQSFFVNIYQRNLPSMEGYLGVNHQRLRKHSQLPA